MTTTAEQSSADEPVRIWGGAFVPWTLTRTVDEVDRLVRAGRPSYFVTANVHTLMVADADPQMRAALDGAAFVLADGMPIVWAARMKGRRLPGRVAGADLLPALCERAAASGHRVFFLGGPPGVGEEAARRLTARYPGLQVVGTESPPFRPPTPDEERELVGRIRAAKPHLLFVLFGQPKGEFWIRRHLPALGGVVCTQLGGSLDFVTGRISRAPRWAQRAGLEWVFRLANEPRRLAGRYARNAWFLARMVAADPAGWLVRRWPDGGRSVGRGRVEPGEPGRH
ncbi:MAG: WecB/TagA/CpsF family glycosyltransferase [Gemmataceae bacterium]|nr:WecB/TagA/CpsF family glycosyltransferase [Gemmataceae bacterium]